MRNLLHAPILEVHYKTRKIEVFFKKLKCYKVPHLTEKLNPSTPLRMTVRVMLSGVEAYYK